jgi:hypothetical protein
MHDEERHGDFKNLCEIVIQYVKNAEHSQENRIEAFSFAKQVIPYYTMVYPILIVQGDLVTVEQTEDSDLLITKVDRAAYRRSVFHSGMVEHFHIDVLTERVLAEHLDLIKRESNIIREKLEPYLAVLQNGFANDLQRPQGTD